MVSYSLLCHIIDPIVAFFQPEVLVSHHSHLVRPTTFVYVASFSYTEYALICLWMRFIVLACYVFPRRSAGNIILVVGRWITADSPRACQVQLHPLNKRYTFKSAFQYSSWHRVSSQIWRMGIVAWSGQAMRGLQYSSLRNLNYPSILALGSIMVIVVFSNH